MSNNYFRFKQFTVYQDCCAMKVGTDGVLLGAWVDVANRKKILDVGTGTGLIALMVAQRNKNSFVDAIDIDKECIKQAQRNVATSPFAQRIDVQQISFQDFAEQTEERYDLILSNPPYFQDSLKSLDTSRNQARHNDLLSFYEIISRGSLLLSEAGCIALILPYEFKEALFVHAQEAGLYPQRVANVMPTPYKPAKRLLAEFCKAENACVETDLIIEHSRHNYSDEFKRLTKDFYLEK